MSATRLQNPGPVPSSSTPGVGANRQDQPSRNFQWIKPTGRERGTGGRDGDADAEVPGQSPRSSLTILLTSMTEAAGHPPALGDPACPERCSRLIQPGWCHAAGRAAGRAPADRGRRRRRRRRQDRGWSGERKGRGRGGGEGEGAARRAAARTGGGGGAARRGGAPGGRGIPKSAAGARAAAAVAVTVVAVRGCRAGWDQWTDSRGRSLRPGRAARV